MVRVLVAMMFFVVVLSGCTGQDVSGGDVVGVSNVTGNVSEQGLNVNESLDDGFSVIIELKEPPKEVIGG